MTREHYFKTKLRKHYFKTKLRTGLPSAVAGLAAFGAMTLVRGELAAQVGLLVYFPVLVLMSDGIDTVDRERLKRFFERWRRKLALKRRAPHSAAIG